MPQKTPLAMEPDKIETYKTEKPRKQHAVETDDPSASIQWAKSSLHAALRKLSQLDAFSPPQRSNGVDYFSVLLLIVWLRLAQLYYDALRNDRSGQELICELRELLQELLPLPDEWCFRRMTAWTPSVRQIQEKLLQHWQQTNERPKMRDIVLHLSHSSNQSSNNKCEDALRNQLAQWVGRARYRYGIHAEILTPTEKRWLDALLMCDDEAQRQTV